MGKEEEEEEEEEEDRLKIQQITDKQVSSSFGLGH